MAAILITDGGRNFGEPPVLRYGRNGWEGSREYLIDTMDEYSAIQQCPDQYGSSWSSALKDCVVTDLFTRYIAKKDGSSGTGGLTVVHAEFSEPGTGARLPPPIIGQKFTLLASETDTVTVYFDRRALPDAGSPPNPLNWPLHNGDGVSKKVGLVSAKVYSYIPTTTFPNLARIFGLLRRHSINSDAVQLPAILGTTTTINLQPGQCQYDGFDHQLVGAVGSRAIEIVHSLLLAPDFLDRWKAEDEDGNSVGSEIQSQIYDTEPFFGLW